MKDPAEIQGIVIPDNARNLIDGVSCIFQQYLCVGHPKRSNELHRCFPGIFFEVANEPAHTHTKGRGIRINIDVMVVIHIKVRGSSIHLPVQKFVFQGVFLGYGSVEDDEQMA